MYSLLLHQSIIAAVLAGKEILEVYDTKFNVEYKEDKSPLTLADKKASEKIIEELERFKIPVLSEEGFHDNFETRKTWDKLWIVDPLDGTKEFVKRNGEFTVNIALVEDNVPSTGVIYSPVFKDLYFAAKGMGAFKIQKDDFVSFIDRIQTSTLEELLQVAKKLPIVTSKKNYVVVASRSHMSKETYEHIENLKLKHKEVDIVTTGSSIKMCWVAEGVADEYPRFGPTMEWDTAAGQAILQESGASLIDYISQLPMTYNRENLLNNWFIAKRN
ncbi:MAG: 3(2),5-bisphosphate nucleotidase [Bacteroidetes bacterium]|jgi:3'(2'), 5'-bisphosphate nucleotidase|nr:3(2),5-bisphosphate nucleotidase [Bacteroidota bacterium]